MVVTQSIAAIQICNYGDNNARERRSLIRLLGTQPTNSLPNGNLLLHSTIAIQIANMRRLTIMLLVVILSHVITLRPSLKDNRRYNTRSQGPPQSYTSRGRNPFSRFTHNYNTRSRGPPPSPPPANNRSPTSYSDNRNEHGYNTRSKGPPPQPEAATKRPKDHRRTDLGPRCPNEQFTARHFCPTCHTDGDISAYSIAARDLRTDKELYKKLTVNTVLGGNGNSEVRLNEWVFVDGKTKCKNTIKMTAYKFDFKTFRESRFKEKPVHIHGTGCIAIHNSVNGHLDSLDCDNVVRRKNI